MQPATLAQLAVTGLLAASLPLAMVWISADANKYRKLVWAVVFLTFDLIVFGGFTRLTDSGLGCPDWPGCYGLANPFQAHEQISAANALMPTGPVSVVKAWIEMIHRYLAMGIGVLIMALMAKAWLQWRRNRSDAFAPALPTALFLFVCVQGAFGAWTVTMKLQPVIVTIHLLLGMGLLALLTWMGGREDYLVKPQPPGGDPAALRSVRPLAIVSAVLLVRADRAGRLGQHQLRHAGLHRLSRYAAARWCRRWTSNTAFTLWRELGKTAAGPLPAVRRADRDPLGAPQLRAVSSSRCWAGPYGAPGRSRRCARPRATSPSCWPLQFFTGLATVFLSFPLAIAVLHNAGAALLVLLVTMLNYKTKYHRSASQ